jgi:hypothetical protein
MAVVVEVTPHPVTRRGLDERRLDSRTGLETLGASSGELAPGGKAVNVRNGAGNGGQPRRLVAVDAGQ